MKEYRIVIQKHQNGLEEFTSTTVETRSKHWFCLFPWSRWKHYATALDYPHAIRIVAEARITDLTCYMRKLFKI
jgi:hypothetical protein